MLMATLKIGADLKNYIINLIKSTVRDVYYPIGRTYITIGSEDPNNRCLDLETNKIKEE